MTAAEWLELADRVRYLHGRGILGVTKEEGDNIVCALRLAPCAGRTKMIRARYSPSGAGATALAAHYHHPSTTHMGDCSICGNVSDHPLHIGSASPAAPPVRGDRGAIARAAYEADPDLQCWKGAGEPNCTWDEVRAMGQDYSLPFYRIADAILSLPSAPVSGRDAVIEECVKLCETYPHVSGRNMVKLIRALSNHKDSDR